MACMNHRVQIHLSTAVHDIHSRFALEAEIIFALGLYCRNPILLPLGGALLFEPHLVPHACLRQCSRILQFSKDKIISPCLSNKSPQIETDCNPLGHSPYAGGLVEDFQAETWLSDLMEYLPSAFQLATSPRFGAVASGGAKDVMPAMKDDLLMLA